MGRDELVLKVLNGAAKNMAGKPAAEETEILRLVKGVMNYMMETGTELLHLDNLYVQISFWDGTVMSFLIDDGTGRVKDLEDYTDEFEVKLTEKKKSGLGKLIGEVSGTSLPGFSLNKLVFSKN
ncbi:MAG: hypothetical protein P8100_06895 [bacterium]|jgi:hypothetical protein